VNLLPKFHRPTIEDQQANAYNEVLRYEAKLGGQLFGPVPLGHRREFFCLDKHTWVWYEEWLNENGQQQVVTTRYQVRPDGILKSQNGGGYRRLAHAELHNLYQAAELYAEVVPAALQRLLETK
jgi:hypothetical protein